MVYSAIDQLLTYALKNELICREDEAFCRNALLDALGLEAYEPRPKVGEDGLEAILSVLSGHAVEKGLITDSPASQDAFTTRLMGLLTPLPSAVQKRFWQEYAHSPIRATDWFYAFCKRCDYIRSYRLERDLRFRADTAYGELEITINLAKPEKDPRDIAAAKGRGTGGYPACLLCGENEGYAGNFGHPARQNLRIIPLSIAGEDWGLQYSPYVYYPEHCIVLNRSHLPMKVDETVFAKLFSFLDQFPHYFIGSNAGLPIVGGSILAHEHFQGGRYLFPIDLAPMKQEICFGGFEDVKAGLVDWPMPVLRLEGPDSERLCALGGRILACWRGYSDEAAGILSETNGEPHNTITPIARLIEGRYRLDLALRNNRTSPEFPLGIFHPHEDKHNIKKENIGLIEVMGLAVLPARLKTELALLKETVLAGGDLRKNPRTAKHAAWFERLRGDSCTNSEETLEALLRRELGKTFAAVLEDAGVFKRSSEGEKAFARFIEAAKAQMIQGEPIKRKQI